MKILVLFITMLLSLSLLPQGLVSAAARCTICIVEVQTIGSQGQEDQDFIVIQSASRVTSVQLRYYTTAELLASTQTVTIEVGTNVLTGQTIMAANPHAKELTLALYSGGGRLELVKGSTKYHTIAWDSLAAGTTLALEADEFMQHQLSCNDVVMHEIQPFAADNEGRAIDVWLELYGGTSPSGDCYVVNGVDEPVRIASSDLPVSNQRAVVVVPVVLTGGAWFGSMSRYGDVVIPIDRAVYVLAYGQTAMFANGSWRPTYLPTPGETNVYQSYDDSNDDPLACADVKISELLPNPAGEDTDKEWFELVNEGTEPASLVRCQVIIAGTAYGFSTDDILAPGEWRAWSELYGSAGDAQSVALRNSGQVLVSLQRLRASGLHETLQSFIYMDAPESQSWARFMDGWRWISAPSPNADNSLQLVSPEVPVPEEPVSQPPANPNGQITSVSITELLPNPAAPGTDSVDEFIELYNFGDQPVALRGYKLQTGTSFSYSYELTDHLIQPQSYIVITSGTSNISLANSAGRARLLNPDGQTVSETMAYFDAGEGQSWAFTDGSWRWTAAVTPGTENRYAIPLATALSKAKTTATKAASTTKSAQKSTTKVSAAKTTKPANTNNAKATNEGSPVAVAAALHPVILATVGALAVLYAAYEYRQDIANRLYQLRSYRKRR